MTAVRLIEYRLKFHSNNKRSSLIGKEEHGDEETVEKVDERKMVGGKGKRQSKNRRRRIGRGKNRRRRRKKTRKARIDGKNMTKKTQTKTIKQK